MSQEAAYFCYLPIRTYAESYIGFALLCLGLSLFACTLVQLHSTVRRGFLNFAIRCMYLLLVLWGAVYSTRMTSAEVVFWLGAGHSEGSETATSELNERVSVSMFVEGVVAMVLEHTIFLLAIYNWTNNLTRLFRAAEKLSEKLILSNTSNQIVPSELILDGRHRRHLGKEVNYVTFLKVYLFGVRLLFLAMLAVFVVSDLRNLLFQIILIALQLEELFIVVLLGAGIYLIKRNEKIKQLLETEQLQSMVWLFQVLEVCMLVRFITDFILGYQNLVNVSESDDQCVIDQSDMRRFNKFAITFLLTDVVLTHYLAIFVVLRIYRVGPEKQSQNVDSTLSPSQTLAS